MTSQASTLPSPEAFRAEVTAILATQLPTGFAGVGALESPAEAAAFVESWRATLHRNRLLGITWPVEFGGRGLSRAHQVVLVEELARRGVPYGAPYDTFSLKMLGNILLLFGSEEQKLRFLPAILDGTEHWCQGFSEPGAGSDLASLRTRATADGEHWVIDGQKVWTSHAQDADWIFVLARTEAGARGHHGISFLLVPLNQPGVEVRPIRQPTGASEFNEVFFTGARTQLANIVGAPGEGWRVAMSLLGFERGEEAATNPIAFRMELDRLISLAAARGLTADPVVRDALADCLARVEVMRHLGERVLAAALSGTAPGPESSVVKLFWSEYHQRVTSLAMNLLGMSGQVLTGRLPLRAFRADDGGAPPDSTASWSGSWANALSGTIYAGTSEVQRNIIAEQALGLPKELRFR